MKSIRISADHIISIIRHFFAADPFSELVGKDIVEFIKALLEKNISQKDPEYTVSDERVLNNLEMNYEEIGSDIIKKFKKINKEISNVELRRELKLVFKSLRNSHVNIDDYADEDTDLCSSIYLKIESQVRNWDKYKSNSSSKYEELEKEHEDDVKKIRELKELKQKVEHGEKVKSGISSRSMTVGTSIENLLTILYPDQEMPHPTIKLGEIALNAALKQLQKSDQDRNETAYDVSEDVLLEFLEKDPKWFTDRRMDTPGQAFGAIVSIIRYRAMDISMAESEIGFDNPIDQAKWLLFKRQSVKSGNIPKDAKWTKFTSNDVRKLKALKHLLKNKYDIDINSLEPEYIKPKNFGKKIQYQEEVFGTPKDGGGAPSGGHSEVPMPEGYEFGAPYSEEESTESEAKVLIDDVLGGLKESLSDVEKAMIDAVVASGSDFSSNISDNMNFSRVFIDTLVDQKMDDEVKDFQKLKNGKIEIDSSKISKLRSLVKTKIDKYISALPARDYKVLVDAWPVSEARDLLKQKEKYTFERDKRIRSYKNQFALQGILRKIYDALKQGQDVTDLKKELVNLYEPRIKSSAKVRAISLQNQLNELLKSIDDRNFGFIETAQRDALNDANNIANLHKIEDEYATLEALNKIRDFTPQEEIRHTKLSEEFDKSGKSSKIPVRELPNSDCWKQLSWLVWITKYGDLSESLGDYMDVVEKVCTDSVSGVSKKDKTKLVKEVTPVKPTKDQVKLLEAHASSGEPPTVTSLTPFSSPLEEITEEEKIGKEKLKNKPSDDSDIVEIESKPKEKKSKKKPEAKKPEAKEPAAESDDPFADIDSSDTKAEDEFLKVVKDTHIKNLITRFNALCDDLKANFSEDKKIKIFNAYKAIKSAAGGNISDGFKKIYPELEPSDYESVAEQILEKTMEARRRTSSDLHKIANRISVESAFSSIAEGIVIFNHGW